MALYRRLISAWEQPSEVVPGAEETPTVAWDDTAANDVPAFMERMQMLDTLTYLPDDILTKVDRASMAVSLEARVPLLDHRVVEFAWSLPRRLRVRDGQGKWLLRRVLERYVPRKLIERPKMGFGIPVDHWLKGPLRDWAEDLLAEPALADGGLLNPTPVRAAWAEHLSGRRNLTTQLWCVLMFQAWRNRWMAGLSIMCGIAGIIAGPGRSVSQDELAALSEALIHRGPDDEGVCGWTPGQPVTHAAVASRLPNSQAAFAHRRLSIIDTGPGGHQPMTTEDGRHVLITNGEIYNYLELRRELETGRRKPSEANRIRRCC